MVVLVDKFSQNFLAVYPK